ncbi:MAG: flagellar biosynthetic protein FliR [Methyloligellaceae bacterium]
MTLTLEYLPQTAYAFMLIFARSGAMIMGLPGIGDRTVPPRIRLVLALALAVILYPLVNTAFPPLPKSVNAIIAAMVGEIMIGLAIGFTVRMIISAIQVAGSLIAVQTGLAFAQNVDPTQGIQSTLFSSFLSVLAVTLVFASDLHHLLLAAMHDSYILFKPGSGLPSGDFAKVALETLANGFRIATQLAAPFLVFGLIFYLGVGVLTRLIPQVQVFFLAMPANIMLGLVLVMLLLSTMMIWFMDYFGAAIRPYLA